MLWCYRTSEREGILWRVAKIMDGAQENVLNLSIWTRPILCTTSKTCDFQPNLCVRPQRSAVKTGCEARLSLKSTGIFLFFHIYTSTHLYICSSTHLLICSVFPSIFLDGHPHPAQPLRSVGEHFIGIWLRVILKRRHVLILLLPHLPPSLLNSLL